MKIEFSKCTTNQRCYTQCLFYLTNFLTTDKIIKIVKMLKTIEIKTLINGNLKVET